MGMFDPEDEIGGNKHFDLREEKTQKKKLKKKQKRKNKVLEEGADLTDSRFADRLINSDEFAIDRTHSSYKPSKAMEELHRKKSVKKKVVNETNLPPKEEK